MNNFNLWENNSLCRIILYLHYKSKDLQLVQFQCMLSSFWKELKSLEYKYTLGFNLLYIYKLDILNQFVHHHHLRKSLNWRRKTLMLRGRRENVWMISFFINYFVYFLQSFWHFLSIQFYLFLQKFLVVLLLNHELLRKIILPSLITTSLILFN